MLMQYRQVRRFFSGFNGVPTPKLQNFVPFGIPQNRRAVKQNHWGLRAFWDSTAQNAVWPTSSRDFLGRCHTPTRANFHLSTLRYCILRISEQSETENLFLRIGHWNRNGINFIFVDLVSMYGEITYWIDQVSMTSV